MNMSEEQFQALKEWMEKIARTAVANDRPMHNRLPKDDSDWEEQMAHSYLVEGI